MHHPFGGLGNHGFVDMAVVVTIENHQLFAPGYMSSNAHHLGIGTGGRQGELPVRQTNLLRQQATDLHRIGGRQQKLRAALHLPADSVNDRLGCIAHGHAQVGHVEIQIAVAIHVGELGAAGMLDEGRTETVERNHPSHRHALWHVRPAFLAQRQGTGRTR